MTVAVGSVLDVVRRQSRVVLETYRLDAGLVEEHANGERRIAQGGYGDRQIFELVQNAADELRGTPRGEVAVVLTDTHLYCANEGTPITAEGVDTILRMSVSRKRGGQIGRFGVGVKSVLAVTDAPEFFSTDRGVRFGFGFDRQWAADNIRRVQPGAGETPVLRMARELDVVESCAADVVLAELLAWATTVVRLPLKPEKVLWLANDLQNFPIEFPLFSAHVGAVKLEDRRTGFSRRRHLYQDASGTRHTLQEERSGTEDLIQHDWRVFTATHRPSETALLAAGELHDRPEIDISWAVPRSSSSRGMFWSYFPTKFATTLRGILNAPWKTSEDRQAIFDGNAFNDELIEVAAGLVIDSLPHLARADDPAVYLDFLPGRGREAPQFADDRLTTAVWSRAAVRASLVNQDGVFRAPRDVRLHPEGLRVEWLRMWANHPGRPVDWVHHSADGRERRARVKQILDRAGRGEATVIEWLEALVADRSVESSAMAIRILGEMHEAEHPLAVIAARAAVILTEIGDLVAPVRGNVFRRSSDSTLSDDYVYVDERVVEMFGVSSALDTLGVRDADAAGRFASIVDRGFDDYGQSEWRAFWELARQAGSRAVDVVLDGLLPEKRAQLKIRTVAGAFRSHGRCLLPGRVVPRDGSRDGQIAADLDFHADDEQILHRLGMRDTPVPDRDPQIEPWFDRYRQYAWESHVRTLDDTDPRPQVKTMRVQGANPAGPLQLLFELSHPGTAEFLMHLPEGSPAHWTAQVGRQQSTRITILSPLAWLAEEFCYLHTSHGLRPVPECVSPKLHEYADVFPVARIPASVDTLLQLPRALAALTREHWSRAFDAAAVSLDDEFAGRLYSIVVDAEAMEHWPADHQTRCRIGDTFSSDVPDAKIAVTSVRSEYDALVRERVPALLVPENFDPQGMRDTWGMRSPADVIKKEVRYVAESGPTLLLDLFPHLRSHRDKVDGWSVVRCSELDEVITSENGMRTERLDRAEVDRTVLVLGPADDFAVLKAVDAVLKLGLGDAGCRSILERLRKQRETDRMRVIREAQSVEQKLVALIGPAELRARLPQGLLDYDRDERGEEPSDERVARLSLNAHGEGILRAHAKAIADNNNDTPRSFTGGVTAQRFVADLDLPESFAGATTVSPPEREEVDGPSELSELHRYQAIVVNRIVELLRSASPKRGMLRLPTGAGKTRVAVEAVTDFVRSDGIKGPILWIAQSDELCEQAVQTWKYIWARKGPEERLTISRFWGGNSAAAVTDNPQLVVAIDDTLTSKLGDVDYAWLRNAALVIVDEAHGGITKTYTGIFDLLGISNRGGTPRTARPLLGLTATPFRSNEQETSRLVERFGGERLDDNLFPGADPYAHLQDIEVLARVEHRVLDGSTLSLSQPDLASVEQFNRLPRHVEEQLGRDAGRNRVLIESIEELAKRGLQTLVFAASVNHAQLLAAQLNGRDVPAAYVDGAMPMSERRRKLQSYGNRNIRVITNYGVLAQGFDAPKTQAVVIARPTYSPNLYQQMVGRGLRGPKNGGEPICEILDVQDNVQNYGKKLAFTDFEYLWKRP